MVSIRRSFLVTLLMGCVFWGGKLAAQSNQENDNVNINPAINSPLSRFGLGNFVNPIFSAPTAMGGMGVAYNDPYHLNTINPAALAHLRNTAFEVGLYARYSGLSSPGESSNLWGGNLGYMALGFPLRNPISEAVNPAPNEFDWGMSFSLQPYTIVGYDVEALADNGENIGSTTSLLKGTGGTYRVYWSNGIRYKQFALGLQLGYTFGKITNSTRIQFNDYPLAYFTELRDEYSVRGLVWRVGAQYTYDITKRGPLERRDLGDKRLIAGAFVQPASDFRTNGSQFFRRDFLSVDTLFFEDDIDGNGRFPLEFGVGVTYEEYSKLKLGAEMRYGQWSDYTNDAQPETLLNSYRFALGSEWIPDAGAFNSYFARVRYRAGAFYETDPRSVNGEQLTGYGLTLGAGFPIILPRQRISFIDFTLEGGRFGQADVLQETYVQITLGFTLNDNTWFFKRKFN